MAIISVFVENKMDFGLKNKLQSDIAVENGVNIIKFTTTDDIVIIRGASDAELIQLQTEINNHLSKKNIKEAV